MIEDKENIYPVLVIGRHDLNRRFERGGLDKDLARNRGVIVATAFAVKREV
jgi:hypothetical protein